MKYRVRMLASAISPDRPADYERVTVEVEADSRVQAEYKAAEQAAEQVVGLGNDDVGTDVQFLGAEVVP
jgi:hypothetical protein